jgi:hypothetical protein
MTARLLVTLGDAGAGDFGLRESAAAVRPRA